MVLKEAFRYQNFLANLFDAAEDSLLDRDHCLRTIKTHYKNKANPDIESEDIEIVTVPEFFANDQVIAFIVWLIAEREKLAIAISQAKEFVATEQGFDLDAAIESNKYRQKAAKAIQTMLSHKGAVRKERGTDYRFNLEGTQVSYYYDIDTKTEEAYDRESAKATQKELSSAADKTSTQIDTLMVTPEVDYAPPYDVNDSFDEVMSDFIKTHINN